VREAGHGRGRVRPRLSFFWDVHNDFFEENRQVPCRAAIYARVMRDKFGAKKPISLMLRTHAQTAASR